MMFSQGKITKDELDKAGKIESDLDMLEDKSNSKKQTDEATQPNNNSGYKPTNGFFSLCDLKIA